MARDDQAPAPHAPTPDDKPLHDSMEEGEEAPPHGVGTAAVVRWLILAAMVLAATASFVSWATPLFGQGHGDKAAARYYCPMHPQITSDLPGECPICHMTLEPIPADRLRGSASASATAAPSASAPVPKATAPVRPAPSPTPSANASASASPPAAAGYTCPMHPEVHSDHPGRCPKCGMDLVAVAPPAATPSGPPPGTAEITVTLDRLQAIGVRTALVERTAASASGELPATIEAPEGARAEVHARAAGFVESIRVGQVGTKVKAGELLASVYIPAIYEAQQELLAVSKWGPSPAGLPSPAEGARRKLELLGLGKATIDRVVAKGEPIRAIGLSSPIAGYVVKKNVVLGSAVMPETALYEIADLSKVYVAASVPPALLASLGHGATARFTTPAAPGRIYDAKIDLVEPSIDLSTRLGRVRLVIDNRDLALRPGQFGSVALPGGAAAMAAELTVPIDALVDTGRHVYVFVDLGGGRLAPRVVETGPEIGERVVIRSGLTEGQRVVSRATFLIDAESRLQASLAGRPESTP